jgi:hypothetical protein
MAKSCLHFPPKLSDFSCKSNLCGEPSAKPSFHKVYLTLSLSIFFLFSSLASDVTSLCISSPHTAYISTYIAYIYLPGMRADLMAHSPSPLSSFPNSHGVAHFPRHHAAQCSRCTIKSKNCRPWDNPQSFRVTLRYTSKIGIIDWRLHHSVHGYHRHVG